MLKKIRLRTRQIPQSFSLNIICRAIKIVTNLQACDTIKNKKGSDTKMKVLIFSDSHRSFNPMMKAVETEGDADRLIHAGDVHSDVEDLLIMYPHMPIAFVKGNNDPFLHDVPTDRFFTLDGVKIFLTHGHNYGVKYSLSKLYQKANELGADICIFGHTHSAHNEKIGNIIMFNPGAAHKSYGILEITAGEPRLKVKEI